MSALLAVAGGLPAEAQPAAPGSRIQHFLQPGRGTYVDGGGGRHTWSVDTNGALVWNGKPFIPVGGMFCFGYLSEYDTARPAANEARWKQDLEILELIAKAGIRHLYVNPVNPATRYPAAVWNRCLRELDARGFFYGIELTDGPAAGMDGILLGGSSWKATRRGDEVRYDWQSEFGRKPRLVGVYAVSREGRAALVEVSVPGVSAKLPAWAIAAGSVLLPRIEAPKGFNVADLWGGYEEYEARALGLLGRLHRGPGLRLVVDPLTNEMNFYGYTSQMVPVGETFRAGLADWLRAKYGKDLSRLRRDWGLESAGPSGWAGYARLVPVPAPRTGKRPRTRGWLLDPAALRCWSVRLADSRILLDLLEYRDASVAAYCSRIGQAIRRKFADVPVVVKHVGRYARYLALAGLEPGIEGVGIEAWGENRDELALTAGPPLAVIRHWQRPGWLLVTETAPSPIPRGRPPGYPDRNALFSHLNTLVEFGARGLYVFALRPLPEQELPDFCLYRAPQQLRWLAEYATGLESGGGAALLASPPRALSKLATRGHGLTVDGWPAGGREPRPVKLEGGVLELPAFR